MDHDHRTPHADPDDRADHDPADLADGEAEVTRWVDLAAPVDQVWELVADPVSRSRWLDDDDARGRVVEPGPGEPGRSVSWTWWHPDDSDSTGYVRVTLDEAVPGVTTVVVTERRLRTPGPVVRARAGARDTAVSAWDLRLLGLELLSVRAGADVGIR